MEMLFPDLRFLPAKKLSAGYLNINEVLFLKVGS